MATSLAAFVTEHLELIATVAAGLLVLAEHAYRTGRVNVTHLPLRSLRRLLARVRRRYYTKPRPDAPGLVVGTDVGTLASALRRAYFEYPPTSYYYAGEVLNLRRPAGTAHNPDGGLPIPVELHVRAFPLADGRLFLLAHIEASRYEAPQRHLNAGAVYSFNDGADAMAHVLTEQTDPTFAPERVKNEAALDSPIQNDA